MRFHDLSFQGYMDRANMASDDESRIDLLMQAALIAEDRGEHENAAMARMRVVESSHNSDTCFETLTAFAYAIHSEHVQSMWMINWCYKWMFNRLMDIAAIPLSTIEGVFDAFRSHYKKASLGTSAEKQLLLEYAIDTGRLDEAPARYEAWKEDAKTAGADCEACRLDTSAQFELAMRNLKQARKVAMPILMGNKSCASVPHCTFARFVLPMLEDGDLDAAKDMYLRGYSLVSTTRGYLDHASSHTLFLGLTGNWSRALTAAGTRMYWTRTTRNDRHRFWSMLAIETAFARALQDGERVVPISCRMPDEVYEEDGLYDTKRVGSWFRDQVDDIAQQFDHRNGTSMYSDSAARVRAMLEHRYCVDLDSESVSDEDD